MNTENSPPPLTDKLIENTDLEKNDADKQMTENGGTSVELKDLHRKPDIEQRKQFLERRKWWIAAVAVPIFAALIPIISGSLGQKEDRVDIEKGVEVSRILLEALYNDNVTLLYENTSPLITEKMPFTTYRDIMVDEYSQFLSPPMYRHFKSSHLVGGMLVSEFESEFDSESSLLEIITLAYQNDRWLLWRIEIVRLDWPSSLIQPASLSMAESSPENTIAFSADDKSFQNSWIPIKGWEVIAQSVVRSVGQRTCDINSLSQASNIKITILDVIDGCAIKKNDVFRVVGRIESINEDNIRVTSSILKGVPPTK